MSYKVKLNIFEGPFDLLVYLIENAEMSIYDIKVSEITSQYLSHLEKMREQEIQIAAEFLVLAATLIELKSKMLLPRITIDGEIEEDPRTDLAEKLIQYTRYKKRAAILEDLREFAAMKMQKPQEDLQEYTNEPDEYLILDMDKFVNAFKAFIFRKKKRAELTEIQGSIKRQKMTVEAKTSFIHSILKKTKKGFISFRRFLKPEADRYDKVVTLVSLLDMTKVGMISVRQKENFADIEVKVKKSIEE